MNHETEINLEQQGDITIFDVQGDVTAFSEPFFTKTYQTANDQGTSKILLKFYEDAYINSGGIAVLKPNEIISRSASRDFLIISKKYSTW